MQTEKVSIRSPHNVLFRLVSMNEAELLKVHCGSYALNISYSFRFFLGKGWDDGGGAVVP